MNEYWILRNIENMKYFYFRQTDTFSLKLPTNMYVTLVNKSINFLSIVFSYDVIIRNIEAYYVCW